jgi:molecular chaperone GrpE
VAETPPALPPAAAPDLDPRLLDALREVRAEMAGLRTAFDDKLREDGAAQQVIDRLHAELQKYKAGLVLELLRPIAQDLIRLADDLDRVACSSPEVAPLLAGFQTTVEEVLARYGFEPFQTEEPTFDARRQRAVKSVPTDDPALDRQVAQRLRKGFRYQDRVVRPELVAVYVREAPRP